PYIFGKCFLDYTKIDAFNIGSEIKKVERTISSFVKLLYGYITQGFDIQIDKEIIDRLNSFKEQFLMTQMLYQIFSTPLIAIALYLVFYSHNLVKKQKKTMIGMIKTRGGTRMQIILFLWGELVVGIIIAIFAGIIIGYLLTGIVRSTTDLLDFSGEIRYGSLKLVVVQDLIAWGVILALCLHFLDILRTSKTSIQKSIEPIDKRPPLWNRYYLDIIASVIGLLGLLLINTLTSSELVDLPILNVLLPILIIPAPFLFFFGFIFFLSRFFPWISEILANLLWQFSGGIKAFSLRNLVQHKHSANRAVIIITLALLYSIFSGTFIYYMDESERIRNYYEMGTEILVRTKPSNHVTTGVQLQNVTGIASTSAIINCALWQDSFPDLYFFFIDPDTFEETAFFVEKHCKLSSSLTDLMNRIRENNSIIIHESQLDSYYGKKIGDSVNYPVDNGTYNITLSFVIQGTFRYWPRFFVSSYFSESLENSLIAIGSLNLFNDLNKSIDFSEIYTDYYIKPESKANLSQVIDDIEDITGLAAFSPLIQHEYYLSTFFRRFLLSTLNSNILICITISVVGITMFAFFTYIQRSKEIGVEIAFGMTRIQIGTSFIIEGSALLLFSFITGSALGILYSVYIVEIFHISGGIIPRISFFPIIFFVKLTIGVVFSASIGTIVPAFLASKKDISRILKND
ncbi:MAG: ABC transporter permease, partial [Candidatus Hodarchaeota archaeon]